jgi:hypothetical protein
MGNAKLLNSGGTIAPRNSSVATEYAGENIPNYCFVSKKAQGTKLLGTAQTTSYSYSIYLVDNLCIVMNKKTATIQSYLNGKIVSNISISTSAAGSGCLVIFPQIKQFILFDNNEAGRDNEYKTTYNVYTWDKNGKISIVSSDKTITATGQYNYRFRKVCPGIYNGNTTYMLANSIDTTSYSSNYYLEKWELNNGTLQKVSQVSMNTSGYSNLFITSTLGYVKELNAVVIPSSNKNATANLVNVTTGETIVKFANVNNSCPYASDAVSYPFGDNKFYDIDNNIMLWAPRGGNSRDIRIYSLTDGNLIKTTTLKTNIDINFVYPMALYKEGYDYTSKKIYCVVGYYTTNVESSVNRIGLAEVDFDTGNSNILSYVSIPTGGTSYATCAKVFYKSCYKFAYSNANHPDSVLEICDTYLRPTILISDSNNNVIYGLSKDSIKQGQEGKIYTLGELAAQEISTYGIPIALKNEIVDDSIDEVKEQINNN